MSTLTSGLAADSHAPAFCVSRALAAVEVLVVYAGILLYIWRWQFTHPLAWAPLAAVVLGSHFLHRDTLDDLGLTPRRLAASAEMLLPPFAALALPAAVWILLRRGEPTDWSGSRAVEYFAGYFVWAAFQQYLAQSFFHRRLMSLVSSPHASSSLVALMFAAAHIPNPALVGVTALAGFVFSEVFARERNLWPLALVHAVGGALVAAILPAAVLHNMRVGPGYFFYGLR